MLLKRRLFLFLCGLFAAPLPALADQKAETSADDANIVVTGRTEETSDWKRAETDHVVVFSDGSESELVRIATRLERLHALMTRLYRIVPPSVEQPRLQVVLFDTRDDMRKLSLRNLRSEEGPFASNFADQRFYDPRAAGDLLAVARRDQIIDLDTKMARDAYCEELSQDGADCTGKTAPLSPPVARTWEAVLYSGFAQRFLLANLPQPYPRWYLDGVGALFSTVQARKDGSLEYARAPANFAGIFRSYGNVNAREVLTGAYLDAPSGRMKWTPYHAWLITHFFVFSNPKPKRQAQFAAYMAALGRGASPAEAAAAFDDLGKLNREIVGYASRAKAFARTPAPAAPPQAPLVTALTRGQVAILEARIRLGDRPLALSATEDAAMPSDASAWIERLRDGAGGQPFDADAMLVAAEAECHRARASECLADADRVLARSPDSPRALALKGVALTEQALTGPANDRAGGLAAARRILERALELNPDEPLAAIAYFQSFSRAGSPVPEPAMIRVAKIAIAAPAAPLPRLILGEELVRQGKADLALRLLRPVLYGPYDSPEKQAAQALFPSASIPVAISPSVGE